MTSAPEIPLDIRELLHDAILALFWPKLKIVEFLSSVGCHQSIIDAVAPDENDHSRHGMVVEAFSLLSARSDRGYPVFQAMIDRLVNWSHFDVYWFETVPKLDRTEADVALAKLRSAIERRNRSTTEGRLRATASQSAEIKKQDMSALTSLFAKLFGENITPQARGYLFERFLRELFNRQSIHMGDPFRITGEQIDGTFKFEGENYIVEAKWQDALTSTGDLYKFAHKVDGKMHGRGLFVSVNAFSTQGIEAIVVGKQIQTILMDGEDISHVLEGRISLEHLLDYKIRAAQTRGDVYVCAVRKARKI
jgi:hypothetical protein